MKSDHVFATVMTAALFSTLGYFALKENPPPPQAAAVPAPQRHVPERAPEVRPGRPAPPAAVTRRSTRPQQRQANGLYKCVSAGQTSYQDQPCQDGEEMEVAGTMSVVPRYPVAERPPAPVTRPPSPSRVTAASAQVAAAPRTPSETPICAKLRAKIRSIDAQARQRSTQNLTDERRETGNLMSELKCSFMD